LKCWPFLSLDPAREGLNEEAAGKPKGNHRRQHIQHGERAQIAVVDPGSSAEEMNVNGIRKSPQAPMKHSNPAALRPGIANGTRIRRMR
jgi:hypothetical protein